MCESVIVVEARFIVAVTASYQFVDNLIGIGELFSETSCERSE